MKKIQLPTLACPTSQRGNYYVGILVFAMFILLLVCVMKIAPAYIDHRTVMNTVQNMSDTGELETMTLTELRTGLMRTLNTNNIKDFEARSVNVVREGEVEFVDITYEKRIHLFKNIDAVVSFSERVPKT